MKIRNEKSAGEALGFTETDCFTGQVKRSESVKPKTITTTMKTFESCQLTWLPCTPETLKPDWLPPESRVRYLYDTERDGTDEYDPYEVSTERFFSPGFIGSEDVGWYPVDESLVPQWVLDGVDEPPPPGWRYYGKGPVKERGPENKRSEIWTAYIAMWDEGRWDTTSWSGNDKTCYYAIREGSELYNKIWPPEVTKSPRVGLLDVAPGRSSKVTVGDIRANLPKPAPLPYALAAVHEWALELGMCDETEMKVRHFVEWYYAQTEGGVK